MKIVILTLLLSSLPPTSPVTTLPPACGMLTISHPYPHPIPTPPLPQPDIFPIPIIHTLPAPPRPALPPPPPLTTATDLRILRRNSECLALAQILQPAFTSDLQP